MSEASRAHYDIVIVGAGIVGATAARLLTQDSLCADLRIALVDPGNGEALSASPYLAESAFDSRVVALSPTSSALLEQCDVWSAVLAQRACPYQSMHVWDAEGTGSVYFDARDLHKLSLGYIVENTVLVRALHSDLPDVNLNIMPQSVSAVSTEQASPDVHIVLDNGQELTSTLLIAADGAQSNIRDALTMPVVEWDYQQSAIVTTVRTEHGHAFTAWQRFTSSGPIAFLPLSQYGDDQQYCSIVWSLDSDRVDEVMSLSDEAFCQRLGREFEHRLGQVEQVDKRFAIPLRQRHTKQYGRDGVVFIGDAAHTIHPLAGQGVNLGFYDVQALCAEIVRACHREIPLSDPTILHRYERRRQPHNVLAAGMMEGFKRLFAAQDPAWRWLRNRGLHLVDHQRWLKRELMRAAGGHSSIV